MAQLPKRITRRKVLEALDVLGIPHTDVRTVELSLHEVTVRELMKPESKAEASTARVERVTVIPTGVSRGDSA
jgi:hypothetical protein